MILSYNKNQGYLRIHSSSLPKEEYEIIYESSTMLIMLLVLFKAKGFKQKVKAVIRKYPHHPRKIYIKGLTDIDYSWLTKKQNDIMLSNKPYIVFLI